ncbi:TauD/TfdA family dioxygenase [Lysobacter pythonis]|uniref:TauD/TfdA family dioxygenase n=1 Tax=Solilutibacter pythonis TaxID=2483112 RepID=A0A3M2HV74_9GAMM|nr:TauD/TfdA family dioxygenase [Lysobacter pythonis]RMH92928.1 TauD/TfdA family dioxygenase [Lysobacter pythonis]
MADDFRPLDDAALAGATADLTTLQVSCVDAARRFPLLVEPVETGSSIENAIADIGRLTDRLLYRHAGMLFRGFSVADLNVFDGFVRSFGHPPISYEFGSSQRSMLTKGVYTSTEFPKNRSIPLHNEQAYTTAWPMKIWLHCVIASPVGGETPVADSRRIYERIDPAIRERFERMHLLYVRNYGTGMDLSWQQTFGTESRGDVENFCHENGINVQWINDKQLRTEQLVQGTAWHPVTKVPVWFNQAHLFHASSQGAEVMAMLLDILGDARNLPRHVFYGDGTPLEDSVLEHIRGVMAEESVKFPWRPGDIVMLDNMLAAHAREPFEGERKVVVSLAEPFSLDELEQLAA